MAHLEQVKNKKFMHQERIKAMYDSIKGESTELDEDEIINQAIEVYCSAEFQLTEEDKIEEALKLKFSLNASEEEKEAVNVMIERLAKVDDDRQNAIDMSEKKRLQKEVAELKNQLRDMYSKS